MEANLNSVEELFSAVLSETEPTTGSWSSHELLREVGRRLDETDAGPAILKSAYKKNVPVFVPAFTDSELGLDCSVWAIRAARRRGGRTRRTA